MKNRLRRTVDATEFEAPKLKIDLAKVFGFAPISLEIPLPIIRNPLSAKIVDPFAIPIQKWRVRLCGWKDGRKGLPHRNGSQLTSFENEILAHRDKKLSEIEKAIQEHRLFIKQALSAAETNCFDAADAIKSIKNIFLDWFSNCSFMLRSVRDRYTKLRFEKLLHKKELDKFVLAAGLNSKNPPLPKKPIELWADVIIAAMIDVSLSFWFISAKKNINQLQAVGFSAVACFINIAVGFIVGKYAIHGARVAKNKFSRIGFTVIAIFFISTIVFGNLMFAVWRDQGQDLGPFPIPWLPLSAFSFYLLTLNLAIFVFTIFKSLYEFNPINPGHVEHWLDFKNLENDVEKWRELHEEQIFKMREIGNTYLLQIRQDSGIYLQHLKNARTSLADYIANLKAHINYWPKLIKNVEDFAIALIKLYRESSYEALQNSNDGKFAYPDIPKADVSFSIEEEEAAGNRALAILKDAETELKQFQAEFESSIVLMVRTKIDEEANIVLESTSSLDKN